jgi:hypothetical protein
LVSDCEALDRRKRKNDSTPRAPRAPSSPRRITKILASGGYLMSDWHWNGRRFFILIILLGDLGVLGVESFFSSGRGGQTSSV